MAFIELKNVSVIYKEGTPLEAMALENISLSICENEFIGIIGSTGAGKSTLVQLLNGLIEPSRGKVLVEGTDLSLMKGQDIKKVRQKIGLVFQYPENQVFEESIAQDIAFGPRNLGLDDDEIHARVVHAMDFVGLDYETFKDRSPFELSGGQIRRVAIAGVLAMKPQVLVLDEPTAGMDPRGRMDILDGIAKIHRDLKITVILISHNMEDVARLASRILVMKDGRLALEGSPNEVFSTGDQLNSLGLNLPAITQLLNELNRRGLNIQTNLFTVEGAETEILHLIRRKQNA
ncbi:MAG: energy-coupling factor transporter ATPase [Clostridia bacterium]|nr:energy-coupling factor transporter ATPase [Clostridia bacterium]